jgi:hypothetical protein
VRPDKIKRTSGRGVTDGCASAVWARFRALRTEAVTDGARASVCSRRASWPSGPPRPHLQRSAQAPRVDVRRRLDAPASGTLGPAAGEQSIPPHTIPAMLHSLKRRVSLTQAAATGGVPVPPEVVSLKQKLAGVKRQLTETTTHVDRTNAAIKVKVSEQVAFARAFAKDFPVGPDAPPPAGAGCRDLDMTAASEAKTQAHAFARQAEEVYNTHCRARSPDEGWARYKAMNEQLKAYCAAVAKVEAKYPRLTVAKSEATRYHAKFDALMQRGKADDLKMTRNLEKTDQFRDRYQALLKEVLEEQRALYAKAPLALRTALVVYWGTNERHMSLISETFDETALWARENERDLAELDVSALDFPVQEDEAAVAQAHADAEAAAGAAFQDARDTIGAASEPSASATASAGA